MDIEKAEKRAVERFLERGFATRHVLDKITGRGVFIWTEHRVTLLKLMQRLFDVPAVHPNIIDRKEIDTVVAILLFTEVS